MDEDGCGCLIIIGIALFISYFLFFDDPPTPAQKAKKAAEQKAESEQILIKSRLDAGETILVKTAPDGTKLWMTKDQLGNLVYFTKNSASSGDNAAALPEQPHAKEPEKKTLSKPL